MLTKYKILDITALSFMLVLSSAGFAHDGHEDQDMVIPNLGNLGIVNFPVSCSDDAQKAVNAWISYETGNTASALAQLRKAADLEDSMDKNPVTPGAVLPARELLADMLMLHGDYSDALLAYEKSLGAGPNRSNSLAGVARAKLAMAQ